MRLRELNIGCFGGGTGLPSLLGGLKRNPWLRLNAVVTMFDSGGSSGQLRDELGVLPPGDILKCALALSRNAREARRVLLARLPTLEHARLGGHTGGNLLLSMMQSYSGDFLNAIDGMRALLGCKGRVWPVSVQQASVCAEYGDGSATRGEVEVDAGQSSGQFVRRIWLEPHVSIHPAVSKEIHQRWQVGFGKIAGSHPRIEFVEAEIDRIGAILDGGTGAIPISSGREKFRQSSRREARGIRNRDGLWLGHSPHDSSKGTAKQK